MAGAGLRVPENPERRHAAPRSDPEACDPERIRVVVVREPYHVWELFRTDAQEQGFARWWGVSRLCGQPRAAGRVGQSADWETQG